MLILDANAVLRFLLKDDQKLALMVKDAICSENSLIPVEVMAEVIFVLQKVYKLERKLIAEKISFLHDIKTNLLSESELVMYAVKTYAATKLDFVDCLLAGYARIKHCSILTFDKDLKKLLVK